MSIWSNKCVFVNLNAVFLWCNAEFVVILHSCLGVQQTTLVKFLGTRQMNSFWVDHIIDVLVVEGVLGVTLGGGVTHPSAGQDTIVE